MNKNRNTKLHQCLQPIWLAPGFNWIIIAKKYWLRLTNFAPNWIHFNSIKEREILSCSLLSRFRYNDIIWTHSKNCLSSGSAFWSDFKIPLGYISEMFYPVSKITKLSVPNCLCHLRCLRAGLFSSLQSVPYFVRLPLHYFVTILIFKLPCINYDLFCFLNVRLSEVIEWGGFFCLFIFIMNIVRVWVFFLMKKTPRLIFPPRKIYREELK